MNTTIRHTAALALVAALSVPTFAFAMQTKVKENIRAVSNGNAGFFVHEKNGVVTLTGHVESRFDRFRIVQAAKNTPGVISVRNNLGVSN